MPYEKYIWKKASSTWELVTYSADIIATGVFDDARIPSLEQSKITGLADSLASKVDIEDWVVNALNVAGHVAAPTAATTNKVWKTDELGNPAWRDESGGAAIMSSTIDGVAKLFSDAVQSAAANAVTSVASRTYGLQLNSSGQLVVNVPWTDTVYTHPAYSLTAAVGTETTLTDITLIDSLTTNSTGHLTGATWRKLVAGSNVTITPAANGNITISSTDTNTAEEVSTNEVGVTVQDKLDEIEQKTDKLESRQVGTTQMSFVNGKLTSVVSDNVSTYLAYDQKGNIQKITETYADGKSYETTYTKDVEGRIKTMTKAEV